MKALQWDLMMPAQRYGILTQWNCEDFGPMSILVEKEWQYLPVELRQILKWMQG